MSIAASAAQATSSAATVVPDVQRSNFLPRLFGQRHFLAGEAQIFDTMRRLSPADYGGEFWEFYERGGEPPYLAPKSQDRLRISWAGDGYEGEVSAGRAWGTYSAGSSRGRAGSEGSGTVIARRSRENVKQN